MSGFSCVIINEGTSASPLASQVTPAWLARCAQACATQLVRDAAPIWGRAVTAVRAGSGSTDVQAGEMVFALVDSLPDAPGAIAYHDVNGSEVPVAFLALSTCNKLDDVSSAISHELLETLGDEGCNRWVDDGKGAEWALELCDAVESNSYPVDIGDGQPPIAVSDFLLPAFFSAGAAGPCSFMGIAGNPVVPTANEMPPAGPFATAAGGYQITRTGAGNETQVTGKVRDLRAEKVAHWSSRVSRRGVPVRGRRRGVRVQLVSPPPTMLGRAHRAFEDAHDMVHHLEEVAAKYPDDKDLHTLLGMAHTCLHDGHDELHDHMDAANRAKSSAVLQLVGHGSMFAGLLLGHVLTTPKEPGPSALSSLLGSISPETKAAGMQLIDQLMQAVNAFRSNGAGVGAPPAAADAPPPASP